jgi:hypothetical protein
MLGRAWRQVKARVIAGGGLQIVAYITDQLAINKILDSASAL